MARGRGPPRRCGCFCTACQAGYGFISESSIRSRKKRHCWTFTLAMVAQHATHETDTATVRVNFEDAADALACPGC